MKNKIPLPIKKEPSAGTIVYIPCISNKKLVESFKWQEKPKASFLPDCNKRLLKRGLCHLTEENAKLHAKFILKMSKELLKNENK